MIGDMITSVVFCTFIYLCVYTYKKIKRIYIIKKYKKTSYYSESKNDYDNVMNDSGTRAEFYIYEKLNKIKGYKKILVNCYIPKEDGTTTEVDLVMIHETGVYVIESKNYKGWIFGNETCRNWTQTLHIGNGYTEKNKFFNPVIQNQTHIKWLQKHIPYELKFFSLIVFGNETVFKNVKVSAENTWILRRKALNDFFSSKMNFISQSLTIEQIDHIYETLKQYCDVSEFVRKQHIDNITNKYK